MSPPSGWDGDAEEAAAVVLESGQQRGRGTTVLAVARRGSLRPQQWFCLGSVVGRIRAVRLATSSAPPPALAADAAADAAAAGAAAADASVREAGVGVPVHVSVNWNFAAGDGTFEVGDVLRACPPEAAKALAAYRRSVDRFLSLRRDVVEDEEEEAEEVEAAEAAEAAAELPLDLAPPPPRRRRGRPKNEPPPPPPPGLIGAVLKTATAGQLQALLDFLRPRVPRDSERLQLIGVGVGAVTPKDVLIARTCRDDAGVPCAVYALGVEHAPEVMPEAARDAARHRVAVRTHRVFHDLLVELLEEAGLPAPARSSRACTTTRRWSRRMS